MATHSLHDDEFGEIVIHRSPRTRHVRMSIAPDGRLRASLPVYAPTLLVTRMLKRSRQDIRNLLAQHHTMTYVDGMTLGKSHRLVVMNTARISTHVECLEQSIIVHLSAREHLDMPHVREIIRAEHKKALQREAKSYLPRRLAHFAEQIGVSYSTVRFSHAGKRWGSCSSSGTISLNIALMRLPHELIDYVLIHELCHIHEMNHSQTFWRHVATADPDYKTHRSAIRKHQPHLL